MILTTGWWSSCAETLENVDYPLLQLLTGPLWLGVVAPGKVSSMGQIEQFDILNYMQANDLC